MSRIAWIVIVVVVVIAAIATGLGAGAKLHLIGSALWPSLWTVVLGVAVIAILIKTAGSWAAFLNYFLFALCGGTLGWIVGILASPATADEARVFGEYKTAIVGFLSGFAISKINDLWKMLSSGTPPLLLNPAVLNRLLLFSGMFLLLVAQQYNARQSAAGAVIVSASVEPSNALIDRTLGTISVKPGAKVTPKGAAAFEEMDVDWSLTQDGSAFSKAVTLDKDVLTIPGAEDPALKDVKKGDRLALVATSRWNRSKTGTLEVILIPDDTAGTPPLH
jgi:hypothetical protein